MADRTGAGDAFIAAFGLGLAAGYDLHDAAVLGVETAGLATEPASGAIEEQVWERITRWVVPPGDHA